MMKRNLTKFFILLALISCNQLPVAGPGGVTGRDIKKKLKALDEQISPITLLSLLSLFSTTSGTKVGTKPADCVPSSAASSSSSSGLFSPAALLAPELNKKLIKIEDNKVYTKESADACYSNYPLVSMLVNQANTEEFKRYLSWSCSNLPSPIDPSTVATLSCHLEEVKTIQLGNIGI